MATRMRLQRFGKKGQPYYHIVIADGRAPRDGRFIEQIGTYNPLTIPATIEINMDKAVSWIQKGASPSDTMKAILSYKGVLYKIHLLKGVAKGALTQEAADAKFEQWLTEKQTKINSKINQRKQESKSLLKEKLEVEAKIKEEREEAISAKRAKLLQKEAKAESKVEEEAELKEEAATEEPEQVQPQQEEEPKAEV